jgi:hypothetical protein
MRNLRETLRSINKNRPNWRREIILRNQVIETLCFRYKIRNQADCGHGRAQIFAQQYLDQARKGTLAPDLVPASMRLLIALEQAYYRLPGRISMAHVHDEPLAQKVFRDAAKASRVVREQSSTDDDSAGESLFEDAREAQTTFWDACRALETLLDTTLATLREVGGAPV